MRAVMPVARPEVLAWRKRTGQDRWDEMWEGVLHMAPMPNVDHQNLEADLQAYLRQHWARPLRAKVLHQINLAAPGEWPDNFRIPDLVLLSPDRFDINRGEYFEGAPDAVVEIYSPGDDTYEKLPFYAELGVPEVWIIDRDTKEPEVHVLNKDRYRKQRAVKGWLRSPATGLELRTARPGKLAIRRSGDDSTSAELPED
jgi:Uma2 family endonuclease